MKKKLKIYKTLRNGAKFEKKEKLRAKLSSFSCKLADWNVAFWRSLNNMLKILVQNKSFYSGNSTLRQKLDQTFFNPPKFWKKFVIKICIWTNLHLLKTWRGILQRRCRLDDLSAAIAVMVFRISSRDSILSVL